MGKDEETDCGDTGDADTFLSVGHIASFSGGVSLYTYLQPICYQGYQEVWTAEGELACFEAYMPVSSLGRKRI